MSETGKACTKCGVFKLLREFRKQKQGSLGRQSHCKVCANEYMKAYRRRTADKRLAYNKKYYASRPGKESLRRYHKKNWPKKSASLAVQRALKNGTLVRPELCESCGQDKRLDAHHDDYKLQTDVRWLCRKCHKEWHAENGEGANANTLPIYSLGTGLLVGHRQWETP